MSGIFGKVGEIELGDRELAYMSEALAHRGPDGAGLYAGEGIAIGCRLLRTRGPDEVQQPVRTDGNSICGVIDGAIYNEKLLWRELESHGHRRKINSDAELLIRLYERYGVDFLSRLRGHFSFAIWDARERRLFLARDHLGQKPLFYVQTSGGFYFASEMKALLRILRTAPELDPVSLDRYLSMRFIPGSGTMVRGICKLRPAHGLIYAGGVISTSRYWRLSFARKSSLSHEEFVDGLEAKFEETVAVHMTPDGTSGAFLSGGLDSSLIVAMMARKARAAVPTFSIGFAEKEFDEIHYARLVARTFGTRQYEARADTDLVRSIPTIIHGLDEPSDPVAASFFAASRLAAEHVKVALGGDGGNELFAGGDRYRGVLLAPYYSMIPPPMRRAVMLPLISAIPASFGYKSLQMKLRWLERIATHDGAGERLAEAVAFFRFHWEEKCLLVTERFRHGIDARNAAFEISERYYESDAEHPIERMVYTDYCTRLPEHLLMLVDRMGMHHGLEVRSPLVDKELVEYMATFPLKMKVRGQQARYVWYKLAERLLPEAIAKREKRGFRFPLARWFAVELHPFLTRVFADSLLAADGVFNRAYMIRLLDEHRSQRIDHSWKIWMLLNLETWYRMTVRGANLQQAQEWIDQHGELSAAPSGRKL